MKRKAGRRVVRREAKADEWPKLVSQAVFEYAVYDIRRTREAKNLSAKELARQCGLPLADVEAVEDGRDDATAAAFVVVIWRLSFST